MKDVIFSWKKYLVEQGDPTLPAPTTTTPVTTDTQVEEPVDELEQKKKIQDAKNKINAALQAIQTQASQLQSQLSTLMVEEKKKKGDRCTRIAKRKYKVWPSAYASGAVVKCRQGKIWKGISEDMSDEEIDRALLLEVKIVGSQQIDKTAGVWDTNEQFNDGTDFKIKFKVSDVIELAKQKPVKEVNPKDINYNFSGRIEDDKETESRVTNADLSYPILVVQNKDNKIFALLDGTHRLEKALRLKLDKIKVKIFDIDELEQFKTNKLEEEWSQKYKRSINCKNPKGFSQKAHCQGRKK